MSMMEERARMEKAMEESKKEAGVEDPVETVSACLPCNDATWQNQAKRSIFPTGGRNVG